MDFAVPDRIQAITGMIDEFVEKELIPMEPEFLPKTFREMLPALAKTRDMVKKMELFGTDAKGLYMLNSELGSRVYAAPSLVLD